MLLTLLIDFYPEDTEGQTRRSHIVYPLTGLAGGSQGGRLQFWRTAYGEAGFSRSADAEEPV